MFEGWLRGRNLRTDAEGYFPCSEYVEYVVEKPTPMARPKPNGMCKLFHYWNLFEYISSIGLSALPTVDMLPKYIQFCFK